MASRAELEQLRKALNRLSAAAREEILAASGSLTPAAQLRALIQAYPEIIAEYGKASAALGADMVEAWASDLHIRPSVVMSAVDPERAARGVTRAFELLDPIANLIVNADKLVKIPYRETVMRSAHASGAAYARVPTGSKTCSFCTMVASRGAVYRTAQSAGEGYWNGHGGCDCSIVMVRGPEDFPEGYDPDALYRVYDNAADKAVGSRFGDRSGDVATKKILAQIRLDTGSSH